MSDKDLSKRIDIIARQMAKKGLLGSHCPICEGLTSNPNIRICTECAEKLYKPLN
jgi:hypothetical protein